MNSLFLFLTLFAYRNDKTTYDIRRNIKFVVFPFNVYVRTLLLTHIKYATRLAFHIQLYFIQVCDRIFLYFFSSSYFLRKSKFCGWGIWMKRRKKKRIKRIINVTLTHIFTSNEMKTKNKKFVIFKLKINFNFV